MLTSTEALRRAEKLFAGEEAVVCGDLHLDYGQFADRCRRLAGGLRRLGVQRGDRVATLMLNCHRYLETYFAVPGMGAVLVPLNNRHALAEHEYILADAGARVLIVDVAHADTGAALAKSVDGLIVVHQYEDLLCGPDQVDLGEGAETDVAGLFYTSGTTGQAKGVMLSHANLTANALHVAATFSLTERDSYLHAAPMFHMGDAMCTFAVTWVGGRHVIVPRFEPEAVVGAIVQERVTVAVLVPTMISALVAHPTVGSVRGKSLRLVIHGGAPISRGLVREAIDKLGGSFTQVYGMTEAGPLLTVNPQEEELSHDRLASAGREVVGVEVVVRHPDGSVCLPGEIGEIVARGRNITAGYWNRPAQTAEVLRDGWYWTGDLGYRDKDEYIYIVDRAKDMIITGGENVYSVEVEHALCAHPSVGDAAVIGIPDDRWGERVHAVVSLKPGTDQVTGEQLREFCKETIAGYKAPTSVEFMQALPKSSAGKTLKNELRKPYWPLTEKRVN